MCDDGAVERYLWVILLVAGAALTWSLSSNGITLASLLVGATILLLAWWTSPWAYGISKKHRDVMGLPDAERRVVVYWRPGCIFCHRLRGGLGKDAKRVTWVNIWQDAEAAAFVRSLNDGNETVPTVLIDGEAHTNPDPRFVRDALAA